MAHNPGGVRFDDSQAAAVRNSSWLHSLVILIVPIKLEQNGVDGTKSNEIKPKISNDIVLIAITTRVVNANKRRHYLGFSWCTCVSFSFSSLLFGIKTIVNTDSLKYIHRFVQNRTSKTSKRPGRWAQRLTLFEITADIELIEIHCEITVPEICTEKRRHDLVAIWRFVTLIPRA